MTEKQTVAMEQLNSLIKSNTAQKAPVFSDISDARVDLIAKQIKTRQAGPELDPFLDTFIKEASVRFSNYCTDKT